METNASKNYTGALLFWSYILFALLFTTLILLNIHSLSHSQPLPKNKKATIYLSILAILSFATLSYNMLHVLFQSYASWTTIHSTPYSMTLPELIGPNRIPLHLWQWSTTTSLFQDFAEAIVASPARRAWTVASLQTTLLTSVYMATEGLRLDIPHLWIYFILLEILPTSFTQILFYITCLRSSNPDTVARTAMKPWMWFCFPWPVCMGLVAEPVGEKYLMATVLLTRGMIGLPLWRKLLPVKILARSWEGRKLRGEDVETWLVWGLLGLQTIGLVWDGMNRALKVGSWGELVRAVDGHPAISALGYDAVISAVAACSWVVVTRRVDSLPAVEVGGKKAESSS